MIYMLDTNICGYIIRNRPDSIKEQLKRIETHHSITLSSIVVSELLYGARKKGSEKLEKIVNLFIDNFLIYDFDKSAAAEYASIRAALERSGTLIGSNDLFIAAHTRALDAVLVTNNVREFHRVKDLHIENWVEMV